MKILFIDNGNNYGHINFNTIHLLALDSLGIKIDVVFNWNLNSQYDQLKVCNNIKVYYLPKYLCKNVKSKFFFRLYAILQLWYIYIFFTRKQYSYIILSAYDAITLFFAGYSSKFLIFDHNNIPQLADKVKLFFTKIISLKCTHLVFNNYMKDGLLEKIPNSKVKLISHGCLEPFSTLYDSRVEELQNKIIFCPSTVSADSNFINSLAGNDVLCNYLKRNNIQLVVKNSNLIHVKSDNIVFLNYYLSVEEYHDLFSKSYAILIPYSHEFKFRTSGVLFECFANNKPFIATKIPAFEIYSSFVNYVPYFTEVEELVPIIDGLLIHKGEYFKNLDKLAPVFQWVDVLNMK